MGVVVGRSGLYDKFSGNQKQKTTLKKLINSTRRGTKVPSVDYFERKLDDKHRLTIPVELREEFASGLVITRGFGSYLHLYPQNTWDNEVEPELTGSILDERTADLNVRFRRGKTSASLDIKQGRVTVEQHLLDYAGIQRDIIAVRAGSYWRVMNPDLPD